MIDHWISNDTFKHTCYCGAPVKGKQWNSVFCCHKHYKVHTCSCGKQLWFMLPFGGSGHDNWDGTLTWTQDILKMPVRKEKLKDLEEKM